VFLPMPATLGARRGGDANPSRVEVTDAGVQHIRADGTIEAILWRDIKAVAIETTSGGAFVGDGFWKLGGVRWGCIVAIGPGVVGRGAAGWRGRIGALARHCPGFDHAKVIEAMGSTHDANFILWISEDWKRRREERPAD